MHYPAMSADEKSSALMLFINSLYAKKLEEAVWEGLGTH